MVYQHHMVHVKDESDRRMIEDILHTWLLICWKVQVLYSPPILFSKENDMNPFMELAVLEALEGIELGHGGPFGAVIVKNGKVISRAHNMVIVNNDPTAHGEIQAIRSACKKLNTFDLTGCEIYTTGYPCPMCFCAILGQTLIRCIMVVIHLIQK